MYIVSGSSSAHVRQNIYFMYFHYKYLKRSLSHSCVRLWDVFCYFVTQPRSYLIHLVIPGDAVARHIHTHTTASVAPHKHTHRISYGHGGAQDTHTERHK